MYFSMTKRRREVGSSSALYLGNPSFKFQSGGRLKSLVVFSVRLRKW